MRISGRRPGYARACVPCHKKKIRCDFDESVGSCSSCQLHRTVCQLRLRKRKHDAEDLSTAPTLSVDEQSVDRLPNTARLLPNSLQQPTPTGHPLQQRTTDSENISESVHDIGTPTGSLTRTGGRSGTFDISAYYGGNAYLDSPGEGHYSSASTLCEDEMAVLRLRKAFTLPSSTWLSSLIESFMKYCYPWMPIVPAAWLENSKSTSITLMKAVLLAGSRTTDIPQPSHDYYAATKALIFSGYERDPILVIVATALLGWWNPSPPDVASLDNSGFWVRTSINMAYQIGLHKESPREEGAAYKRCLWWTLAARDSQLAAAHGRPRMVHLPSCSVRMVKAKDVAGPEHDSQIFVAYVKASLLLGEISTMCQQGSVSEPELERLRNSLLWWTKERPSSAHNASPSMARIPTSENFPARQLFLLHFASLNLLYRKWRASEGSCGVVLAASSLIAGLLETFLARDECRHLAVTLCFYAVVAAIPLVEALSIAPICDDVAGDLANVRLFLETMSKKWPSALTGLKMIQKLQESTGSTSRGAAGSVLRVPHINKQDLSLFEGYNIDNCRLWHKLAGPIFPHDQYSARDAMHAAELPHFEDESSMVGPSTYLSDTLGPTTTEPRENVWLAHFDSGMGEDDYLGGWLANDNFFGTIMG